MARYDLDGTAEVRGKNLPVRMETVFVEHRIPASTHPFFMEDFCQKMRVGDGTDHRVTRLRAILPNLTAPKVGFEASGLRASLEPLVADPDPILTDLSNAGKVFPTCLLHLEVDEDADGLDAVDALEAFGWLLSFYAGRAVHPTAWEGETERGGTWGLAACEVTLPPIQVQQTCLPRSVDALEPFLKGAWQQWLEFDEREKGRMRGVVNLYRLMLSTTFPIERIALTAMYLERFRELVLGNDTVLEQIDAKEKGFDEDKVAKMLRNVLNDLVGFVAGLDHDDRGKLRRAIDGIGGGHVSCLFRPSFQRSLMELYGRARLPLPDRDELKTFIDERNAVVHGYWNPSPENALPSHRLAEYGTNLLEKLILRFFRYDGPYYDRTIGEAAPFEHKDPGW
ncbi:MAG: hypothetical protein M3R38_21165 [Actinomycetota bacterium]|nr:hypothetical protein [Actinomycetota bacterium]